MIAIGAESPVDDDACSTSKRTPRATSPGTNAGVEAM